MSKTMALGIVALAAAGYFTAVMWGYPWWRNRRRRRREQQRGKGRLPRSLSLALARSRRGCQKSCPCRSTPEAAGRAKAILDRLEKGLPR